MYALDVFRKTDFDFKQTRSRITEVIYKLEEGFRMASLERQ